MCLTGPCFGGAGRGQLKPGSRGALLLRGGPCPTPPKDKARVGLPSLNGPWLTHSPLSQDWGRETAGRQGGLGEGHLGWDPSGNASGVRGGRPPGPSPTCSLSWAPLRPSCSPSPLPSCS